MNLNLFRYEDTGLETRGVLQVGNHLIHTLELTALDNAVDMSCIPEGEYDLREITRPDGRWALWVTPVPGRTQILFHSGNTRDDIQGCILPGMTKGELFEKPAVLQSGSAMIKLRSITKGQELSLTIHDCTET